MKDFNLALENPAYSPNALEELEQNIHNFEVEDIERLVITQNNPHHWLHTDVIKIQNFLHHYLKDITLNEQTISQTKLISFFLRKYFRFNYQILWSEQDQPAFEAFHNYFTANECLPFIIDKQSEHPYFFKPDAITKQAIFYNSFIYRLITENNFHDENRPYRYEQNFQEQQKINTNNNYDEDDTNNEEYMLENQNENRNEDMTLNMNENNTSDYTTIESTTSAQNVSQTETSATTQFVRTPTTIISPRQNTHDPQSYSDKSLHRNITFTIPPSPEEIIQDRTHNITSIRDTSVNVLSPTRTVSNSTRITTRPIYDPLSVLQFLNSQIKQFNQKIIIIIPNKLLVNKMIYLITPFFHHLIQIFNQIILKIILNLRIILIQ